MSNQKGRRRSRRAAACGATAKSHWDKGTEESKKSMMVTILKAGYRDACDVVG